MNLQDMFNEAHNNKFIKRSDETRAKMSEAQKGKTFSDVHRANMSEALKGRTFSDEHSANLSKALKGRIMSDEHRANMSAAQKGRPLSDYHRLALRKSAWPLQTPDGIFSSALEYSKFVGVSRITIYKRIERLPDQYYYIKECQECS